MNRRHIITLITSSGGGGGPAKPKGSALLVLVTLVLLAVALMAAACGGEETTATAQAVTTTSPAVTTTQAVTTTEAVATTDPVTTTDAATTASTISLPAPTVAGTIAFAKATDVSGTVRGDIWVVNTDGTGMRQLTATSDVDEAGPAWSPDGSKIAYGSGDPTKLESYTLQVMNADGSGSGPLTGNVVHGQDPRWSPDGSRIAFSVFPGRANVDVAVMNADGSGVRKVTSLLVAEGIPSWLPDGSLLYISGIPGGDIYRVNADGSNPTEATTGSYVGLCAPSPDGSQLVIHDRDRNRLVLLPASGEGTPVVLVDKVSRYVPSTLVSLTWSPDGKAIAFAASLIEFLDASPLFVVNADGSGSPWCRTRKTWPTLRGGRSRLR